MWTLKVANQKLDLKYQDQISEGRYEVGEEEEGVAGVVRLTRTSAACSRRVAGEGWVVAAAVVATLVGRLSTRGSATRPVMVPGIAHHMTRALPEFPHVGTACYLGHQMCVVVCPCAGETDAWGHLNILNIV